MNISLASSYQNKNQQYLKRNKDNNSEFSKVIEAKSKEPLKSKSQPKSPTVIQDGVFKGRFALVNTGLNRGKLVSINYSIESTKSDPIMISSEGDTVHINDIDPSSASELEMQMYCSHLDATGRGTGSTFGTYNDLTTVRMTAHLNGLSPSLGISRDNHMYKEIKSNWVDLTKEVMKIVRGNDKKQYQALEKLLNGISKE